MNVRVFAVLLAVGIPPAHALDYRALQGEYALGGRP